MKILIATTVLLCLALPTAAQAQDAPLPKFKDHPVKTIFKGKPAKPRLDRETKRYYGHLYTSAAEEGVKFAGHYTIVERTCGSTCRIIDILDLKTGKTVKLDFASISGWRDHHEAFEPVEVKADSRLIVFAGGRNEKAPVGYHYYVLENGRLKFLRTVDTDGLFLEPLSKE
jgi:hypothetical protein